MKVSALAGPRLREGASQLVNTRRQEVNSQGDSLREVCPAQQRKVDELLVGQPELLSQLDRIQHGHPLLLLANRSPRHTLRRNDTWDSWTCRYAADERCAVDGDVGVFGDDVVD